ncbi:MAG: methyl-accepting chemotaxis protein [Planctomycetota bacterium]
MSTTLHKREVQPKSNSQNHAGESADKGSSNNTVTEMVGDLSVALESAIGEIHSVNSETKVLALNARIEAARAGTYGAAFSVVAEEMQNLSDKTSHIANEMASRTRDKTAELMSMIDSTIRGTRLSDLALTNIDLIDRNLYERTCDVRWWATDSSLVDGLSDPNEKSLRYASKRLGVILDAYTVYHDLLLCDASGRVVANGRPDQFRCVGENLSKADWFTNAIASRSGDEYGFDPPHASAVMQNRPTAVYSCGVREHGDARGDILGALGIFFNWQGLAQPILDNIPVPVQEQAVTQAYIISREGKILASNQDRALGENLRISEMQRVFKSAKGFYVADDKDQRWCIGHAHAPGFETYTTDWYSIVMQPLSHTS